MDKDFSPWDGGGTCIRCHKQVDTGFISREIQRPIWTKADLDINNPQVPPRMEFVCPDCLTDIELASMLTEQAIFVLLECFKTAQYSHQERDLTETLTILQSKRSGPLQISGARSLCIRSVQTEQRIRQLECLLNRTKYLLKLEQERIAVLEGAIRTHRSQKADDRCIEDDDRLYAVLNDGINCDRHVGSKEAMLKNCARFIENRCIEGKWPSYAELEAKIKGLEERIEDLQGCNSQ